MNHYDSMEQDREIRNTMLEKISWPQPREITDEEVRRAIVGESPEDGWMLNRRLWDRVVKYAKENGMTRCLACDRWVKYESECTNPEEFKRCGFETTSHQILRRARNKHN